MAKIVNKQVVEMDDGEELRVVSDQRDIAKWEVHPQHTNDRPHLMVRFLAWSALNRQGLWKGTFEKFNEQCVEVRDDVDEAEPEGEQGLDPGRPDTAAAS